MQAMVTLHQRRSPAAFRKPKRRDGVPGRWFGRSVDFYRSINSRLSPRLIVIAVPGRRFVLDNDCPLAELASLRFWSLVSRDTGFHLQPLSLPSSLIKRARFWIFLLRGAMISIVQHGSIVYFFGIPSVLTRVAAVQTTG